MPHITVNKDLSIMFGSSGIVCASQCFACVRLSMRCFQLPRTLFSHQTTLLDPEVTSAGVSLFLAKSHSDEIIG